MKHTKIIFLLLVIIAITGTSCKKSFLTNLNNNPNAINDVPSNVLLPTVEIAVGYVQGGDFGRYATLIDQQTFGFSAQPQTWYGYGFNPGTFETLWDDIYTSALENNYALTKVSDAKGYNAYSGISRIMMAYTLQTMVDAWGSIPYSQALQGSDAGGVIYPKYDTDVALYDSIASLVNVGTAYLSNPDEGVLVPGTDDAIYGGDESKWIKFGHAIKARLAIHQSKGSAAMATTALSEVSASFAGTADNATYPFPSAETSANPWYQMERDRPANITFSNSTLADTMLSLNDPRYPIYIDSADDFTGTGLAAYYGSANSPLEFINYDELLFIEAEATLRSSGNIPAAQVFYDSAITVDMQKVGVAPVDIATYLVANGTLPVILADAISQVAFQEYLALYLNPEAWVVWRRTNSPVLVPVSGTAVPRRFEYPQSEYDFNTANTPASTMFTPKIFWDN
jgi:hypothetical protein